MPTSSESYVEIRRLAAARDEALRRYTQHLSAIQLRNSRWSVLLSHGRAPGRGRVSATLASLNFPPHAH
jgi:hypothetical protein